jgi:mRNA-degrading endonuclease HigB of HigAB toxin-antitoxin module
MRLIGRERLNLLRQGSEATEKWVRSWLAEVRDAHWKHPADLKAQFPKASCSIDGLAKFPLPDNTTCIHLRVAFPLGIALISAIDI